jgi:hypothetical protein
MNFVPISDKAWGHQYLKVFHLSIPPFANAIGRGEDKGLSRRPSSARGHHQGLLFLPSTLANHDPHFKLEPSSLSQGPLRVF